MLRAMLRDLRAHRGRIAMTLVAIALGVTFVVATWVLSDSTAASVSGAGTRSDVGVAVRGPEQRPVLTPADRDRLAELPGVTDATGVLAARAALVGADGKLVPGNHERAGTGWDDTGRFALTDGRAPRGDGELALSARAADASGLRTGDRARVFLADGRAVTARVSGVFDYRTLGVEAVPEVAFDARTATTLLGATYDRIELTGVNAVDPVRDALAKPDLRVHTGAELAAEARDDADDAAQSTREALLAFAAVAVLVGTFVIANTFAMLVTQRVRQFALLRAVGASRRQIRRTVLLEAAALGFVGATIGVAVGIGLGLLALWAFGGEHVTYTVTPVAVLVGYAVGIGVTAVAAYGSARRAATVAPVAALRTDATVPRRDTVVRTIAGAVLLAGGVLTVALIAGPGLSTGARVACLAAGVVAWLGVLLLAPVFANAVLSPVARLFRGRCPSVRLATRNAVRDPRRTAATSSALLVGLALVCAFATLGETMVSMLGSAVRTMVPASATMLRSAESSGTAPLGTDVLDRVRATDGVDRVAADRYAFVSVRHDGATSRTTVSAIEADGFTDVLTPELVEGTGDLRRGVVVGTNEAAMLGVAVGDEVTLGLPGGEVRQRIVGTIDTVEGQPLFYVDVDRVPAPLRDRVTTVYAVGADPAATRRALDTAFADRPDVEVTDREAVIAAAVEEFQLLLSVMYAMFGAAVVIAVFGVVNTLALSVAERVRELGVLRAVGATRKLVRRAVRLESVVICAYGGVLGIVVGVLFGAVMQHVMLGNPMFEVGVPFRVIACSLLGMVVVGVLSAAWPARRAARTDVLTAIRTE